VLTLGGFAVFGKVFKNCAFARMKENIPLAGKAATLVVHENISLTTNIVKQ